ncbi:MAG TPA: proton-conducting transporter membrane subunit, partial [bacterium]|nr:proton-conducting transporter membrane subunit [bacterium]
MNLSLLSPEFGVLGLALLVFLLDLFTKDGGSKAFVGWTAAAGLALLLGGLLAMPMPAGAPLAFGGLYIGDGLGYVFKALFLAAALLAVLGSIDYLDVKGVRWQGEHYLLLLIVTAAMMALASAGDLLSLYVALELNAIGFYALTSLLKGRSLVSSEAGLKYLILGAVASAFLLYGISILYGLSGTLSLPGLAAWVRTAEHGPALFLALAFVTA